MGFWVVLVIVVEESPGFGASSSTASATCRMKKALDDGPSIGSSVSWLWPGPFDDGAADMGFKLVVSSIQYAEIRD